MTSARNLARGHDHFSNSVVLQIGEPWPAWRARDELEYGTTVDDVTSGIDAARVGDSDLGRAVDAQVIRAGRSVRATVDAGIDQARCRRRTDKKCLAA